MFFGFRAVNLTYCSSYLQTSAQILALLIVNWQYFLWEVVDVVSKFAADYDKMYMDSFWMLINEFSPEEKRKFLKFVTGCPRPPIMGFAVSQSNFKKSLTSKTGLENVELWQESTITLFEYTAVSLHFWELFESTVIDWFCPFFIFKIFWKCLGPSSIEIQFKNFRISRLFRDSFQSLIFFF